ncbi:phage holin family protein [Lacticaseibacillus absianus]|uniref:phage holin family protein n=1 Tax=Lacticaseibacillus absianus TaxID=2729623 RepID=UPI0015CE59CF|nr:phage holin family protein [Lacticaseibacillus absianus]
MQQLFSGGQPLMGWWLAMVGIDLVTGYAKALKAHRWKSAVNLQGLMTKFVTMLTIIVASAVDHVAPMAGLSMPVNVGLIWTLILMTYEFGSIMENVTAMGVNVGPLAKYLDVFHDSVDPSDTTKKGEPK